LLAEQLITAVTYTGEVLQLFGQLLRPQNHIKILHKLLHPQVHILHPARNVLVGVGEVVRKLEYPP
jgi:hypothetical protein